tara:strand:- start:448 stop:660 length:213 start_codon:yes stop_codon:yes gene_type:complete
MKYALTIFICSFIDSQCSPPITDYKIHNSWNECVVAAYTNSLNFLEAQTIQDINQYMLATKFICEPINDI